MITTTEPDDQGDGKSDLTPEQREPYRRQVERIYEAIRPNLPAINLASDAISKLMADVTKWWPVTVPDSLMKNIAAASIGAEQNARVVDQLMPMFEAQSAWKKQLVPINSDIIKLDGFGPSQFNLIASHLAKNANFGLHDFAQITKLYADQQATWLKGIAPALAILKGSFFPSNLRGIRDLTLEEVEQVVMLDGIALYEGPRTEIAEKLVRAPSSAARREILGRKWREIAADCREVLEKCQSTGAAPMIRFALHVVDALDAGNTTSAQPLAASLVDTILRKDLPTTKPLIVPSKKNKKSDAYLDFSVRKFIALAPIWQAYQNYFPDNGDRVPRTFNRHATVHTVGSQQYSRRNAIQGLMLVCGLLKFLDEQASAREAA